MFGSFLGATVARADPLDSVIGRDNRQPLKTRGLLGRTVGQVRKAVDGEFRSRCTGTLVGDRLVLTANHCVALVDGELDRNVETYFLPSVIDGEMPYGARAVRAIDVLAGNRQRARIGGDWALLLLEEPPSSERYSDFGRSPVMSTESLTPKTEIAAVGYSYDFDDGETAGIASCHIQGRIGQGGLAHDCACDRGASGGPLFAVLGDGTSAVVGLMIAQVDEFRATLLSFFSGQDVPPVNIGNSADNFLTQLSALRERFDRGTTERARLRDYSGN